MKKRIGWRQVAYFKKVEGKYKVYKVLDGDSLVIDLEQVVRLDGVNAPGLGLCLGEEAKERLEELILDKYVKIERTGIDHFKRTLGIVYIEGKEKSINEILAIEGWAKYERTGSEVGGKIQQASHQAKEDKLGVWSPKCYQKENLENPDCLIKGNIGKSDRKKIYHFPGCAEYERTVVELDLGEEWFCTEEEAQKAGYKKSEHCYGKKYEAKGIN